MQFISHFRHKDELMKITKGFARRFVIFYCCSSTSCGWLDTLSIACRRSVGWCCLIVAKDKDADFVINMDSALQIFGGN